LEKTGQKLAEASVADLLESWSRGTAGGQGDVIVTVSNVADVKQSITIKKALEALKGVEEVLKEGAKGNVKYTLQTHLSAENVTEQLVDLKFETFTLDVEDQKAKTIACKVK
jgi:regulator of RNase E activity RraB